MLVVVVLPQSLPGRIVEHLPQGGCDCEACGCNDQAPQPAHRHRPLRRPRLAGWLRPASARRRRHAL